MSRQQPHLTPRLESWPAEWIRNTPAADLTVSSRDRMDQLPSVPADGEPRTSTTDDVVSPRTGGMGDELEESYSATLDTSQLNFTDGFFGGGQAEPSSLVRSSSIEFGKTVELPPMTLPACLEDGCTWAPDHASARCMNCQAPWSAQLRRHHCRLCGDLFCYACAPERAVDGSDQESSMEDAAWAQAQLSGAGSVDDAVSRAAVSKTAAKIRCCRSCQAVLKLNPEGITRPSSDDIAAVLRQNWKSQLTMMQPVVTDMGGAPRREKNLGGAGPWLVQVLRGVAWQDADAQTMLEQLSEAVDYALTQDATAAAQAVAGERVRKPAEAPGAAAAAVVGAVAEGATEMFSGAKDLVSGTFGGLFGR